MRYALDHPDVVTALIGVAGHGLHQDRGWSEVYEARKAEEPQVDVPLDSEVWTSLRASFQEWIHDADLFRALADSPVPMQFIAAEDDIRPDWPLRQLTQLVPGGEFRVVPRVLHDFWATHPQIWIAEMSRACCEASERTS